MKLPPGFSARLGHLDQGIADAKNVADMNLVFRHALYSKILSELGYLEVRSADLPLPVFVILHGVHVSRFVGSAVASEIDLPVARRDSASAA